MTTTIIINGVEYIKKSECFSSVVNTEGLEFTLVRTASAGVYVGYMKDECNATSTCTLLQARRMRRWEGASECGELVTRGTSKPDECKFPSIVPLVRLKGVAECIPVSAEAKAIIDSVPVWTE